MGLLFGSTQTPTKGTPAGAAPPSPGLLGDVSQHMQLGALPVAAPTPAPVYNPKGTLFSRLANNLAGIVTGDKKGTKAANSSLDASQEKLLKIANDQSLPLNHRSTALQAANASFDPSAAAANTKDIQNRVSVPALAKGVASALTSSEKITAQGLVRGVGGKLGLVNNTGVNSGSASLDNAQTALLKVLNDKTTSPSGKLVAQRALDSITQGSSDEAAANTKAVQDATNKRKFTAAAYETGLQPFLLGNPELGGSQVYKLGEGLSAASKLPDVLSGGVQGIAGGLLGSAQADKFNSKEALKSGLINAAIPVGSHILGEGISQLGKVLNKATPAAEDIGAGLSDAHIKDIASAERVPRKDVTTFSGKLDPEVSSKIDTVVKKAQDAPRPEGTTRLFQAVGKDGSSDYYFKTPDELASFKNNTTAPSDTFKFVDAPDDAVKEAAGKPGVFTVATDVTKTPESTLTGVLGHANTSDNVNTDANKVFENATLAKNKTVSGEIKNKFNPVAEYGEAGKQASSDFQSKLGDLSSTLQPVKAASGDRQAILDKLSQKDQLKFINDTQHGVPAATPELRALQDQYKGFNAQGAEIAKGINPNFHEMENYFTQSGLVSKQDASVLAQKWTDDKSNIPGSLKARTFPSVQEAVKFANDNGVPLRETNPERLFINNHQAVVTSGKLREFEAEQASKGVDPAITQKLVDRYSERGISSSPTFQRWRQGSGTANSLQLAGGFHFGKTAFEKVNNDISTAVNETLAGHPLTGGKDLVKSAVQNVAAFGYKKGSSLAKDVSNGVDNKYTQAVKLANFNTSTDGRFAVNGIKKSLDDLKSGSLKQAVGGILKAPFRLVNTTAKPLMNHWVPAIKNAAFMNQVDAADRILGSDATTAEKALAYQKAGNTVDGIMGQMNQDNLFWSKTMKDSMSLAMRSPGYNIGTVQQIGGGLKDLTFPHLTKGLSKDALPDSIKSLVSGKGLSTRSAYTIAMTANTAALGAITTYLFTGHGPTEIKDYFYPPTGKTDKNGNEERVSLPSYSKDIFAFVHNPEQTVSNKLGPAFSTGLQVARNKDYFGNDVRNPNDSLATQTKQTAGYVGKNSLPFALSNSTQRVDKGPGAKAESFLGMGVAPGYITKSPFEQKVQTALNTALGSKPLTPEQQTLNNSKSAAKQSATTGDNSKVDQLVKSGQLTKKQGDTLKASSQNTSLGNQFSYLLSVDRPTAAKLIQNASPRDIQKLGDKGELIKTLQKTTHSKSAKPTTIKASYDLLRALNSR